MMMKFGKRLKGKGQMLHFVTQFKLVIPYYEFEFRKNWKFIRKNNDFMYAMLRA